MPIKFRCAYCNQLMGIARRKAGTVVRCPSCSGQVIVPNPSDDPTEKPPEPSAGEPELFERSDFDELFGSAAGGKRSPDRPVVAAPAPAGSAVASDKPPEFAFDVERVNVAPSMVAEASVAGARPGIVLAPAGHRAERGGHPGPGSGFRPRACGRHFAPPHAARLPIGAVEIKILD